jgi:trigger factor
LKIEKEIRDDHQIKLTVEIDADEFEKAKRRAARQVAKRVRIPGYRPGKAPYGVILRNVGEGTIVEQALEAYVDTEYSKIIEAAEIEPYGAGTLDNVPSLDPPTLEFLVPLEAAVELGDYKSIEFPYEVPETGTEEVQKAIEQIQQQNATRETVERPAEMGDIVFMQVSGKRSEIEDEAEAAIFEKRFSSATIQEDADEFEFPYPGFAMELIGLSIDEEKTINYEYPADHDDEDLKGAKAEFEVTVTNIQSQTLPEIDDELAKSASDFDTLEEWQAELNTNLQKQAEDTYGQEYDDQIIKHLVDVSTVKYPPQMIAREKEEMLRGLEQNLSRQGLTKELYMQIRGLDEAGLEEEIAPVAEDRVKQALVLMDIAKAEDIKADEGQVQAETGRTFDAIASQMTPNEAKKLARSQYLFSLMGNIMADMVTTKTMEYLRATAKGEEWPVETDQPEEESETALEEPIAEPIESEAAETEAAPEVEEVPAETEVPADESAETEAENSPETEK